MEPIIGCVNNMFYKMSKCHKGAYCFSTTGPLSAVLTNRFGYRLICMIGGFIGATGFIFSYYASNIYLMYVSYGALTGLSIIFGLNLE